MGINVEDVALEYAISRRWAVIPLNGKLPAIPKREGGRGCLDASSDSGIIRMFWRKYRDANIGVATGGASGFWVLDVDGEAGHQSISDLEADHGALPPTLRQITGSGGEHYFFFMMQTGQSGIGHLLDLG